MADLGRFLQLVEETESFRGCGEEKVAKIVHYGDRISRWCCEYHTIDCAGGPVLAIAYR